MFTTRRNDAFSSFGIDDVCRNPEGATVFAHEPVVDVEVAAGLDPKRDHLRSPHERGVGRRDREQIRSDPLFVQEQCCGVDVHRMP